MRCFFLSRTSLFFIIFISAFIIRLLAIINIPIEYQQPKSDAAEYDRLAITLLTTKSFSAPSGMPTAYRTPLYPLFLAGIYFIFGHSYFWARFFQVILYSFLCLIVYRIGETLFNKSVALLSSFMCVVYKPFIFFSYYGGPAFLLTEHLFIFLFALSILFLARLYRTKAVLDALFSGIFIGLATLSRPVTTLFPLFLLFWFLFCLKSTMKRRLKLYAILCVSFLFIIMPWTIRNYCIFKQFIFATTESGKLFWLGNNAFAKGGYSGNVIKAVQYNQRISREKDEVTLSRLYFQEGFNFLIKNPKKIPTLFLKKILIFWHCMGDGVLNFYYLILLPLFIFGFFISFRKFDIGGILLLAIIFLYFMFISMCFFGDPRFRYPIEPYIIIFGSMGILHFLSQKGLVK